jgi:hypothetical protein
MSVEQIIIAINVECISWREIKALTKGFHAVEKKEGMTSKETAIEEMLRLLDPERSREIGAEDYNAYTMSELVNSLNADEIWTDECFFIHFAVTE